MLRGHARHIALLVLLPFVVHLPALLLSPDPIFFTAQANLAGTTPLTGLPGFLDLNAGWTTQALGAVAARAWLSGEVPWWNSLSGVGLPLAAAMQPAALFLPFVLLLALPLGVLALKIAMMILAGLATRALLLRLGLQPMAALAGAAMFQLSSAFAWWGDAPMLPVAFLPLLLLGIERARAAAGTRSPAGPGMIALAVGWSLLAGFAQTAWFDGVLAGLWTLLRLAQCPRWRLALGFAARVGLGLLAGLLLAMPQLLPFAHYLPLATLGDRAEIDFRTILVLPAAFAHYLFPYLFGPVASYQPLHEPLVTHWGRMGGYFGIALPVFALLATSRAGAERALRLVLAAWLLLWLARLGGVPGLGEAFSWLPFSAQSQTYRYAFPAMNFAAVVLFALAVDDRLRGRANWPLLSGGVVVLGAGVALVAAWPQLTESVAAVPPLRDFALAAVGLGAVVLFAMMAAARWGGAAMMAGLALAEAALLFALPLASGIRGGRLDTEAIAWLQSHAGLQRIVTAGTLLPNYPAYFGIAGINHVALPVSRQWAEHVRDHLEPRVNPNLFRGDFPWPAAERAAELRRRLPAYAALGVRFVVTTADADPFQVPGPVVQAQAHGIVPLGAGRSLTTDLNAPASPQGAGGGVTAVLVRVGTYLGRAGGQLQVELCAAGRCGRGSAEIAGAADNGYLAVPLDQPLDLAGRLTLRITQPAGVQVALSLGAAPGAATQGPGGENWPDMAPLVGFEFGLSGSPPIVHRGARIIIREIPDAAPYWQIMEGGPCTLAPAGRRQVEATCEAPARLLRQELHFPGWTARRDGAPIALEPAGPLFQSVVLMPGRQRLRFDYAPPHRDLALALAALGLLLALSPRLVARARRIVPQPR